MAENAKINAVLNTRKQLFVSDENIGIQGFSDSSHERDIAVSVPYRMAGNIGCETKFDTW